MSRLAQSLLVRGKTVKTLVMALLIVTVAFSLLPGATDAVPTSVLKCTLPDDFAIPGGWFFQQEKRPDNEEFCLGYGIVDDASASMWTTFYRLGGVKVLGYPVSRRYIGPGGYIQQGFEFAILQWRPEENRGVPALAYEQFHDAGLDPDLRFFSIPEAISPPPGGFGDEAAIRQSWLTDPQITARYLTDPVTGDPWNIQEQAWEFYGLPQTTPERVSYASTEFYPLLSPFVTQRFQRMALRLLLTDDPDSPQNRKGCIAPVRTGALARLLQLIPPSAALEEPSSGDPIVIVEVQPEQFVVADPENEDPVLVDVTLSALNFQPGEVVSLVAIPRFKPTDRAPLPWEVDLTFTAVANSLGEAIVPDGQLWSVEYFVEAEGLTSGRAVRVRADIQALSLDEFPVAVCQALVSTPSILVVPTPFGGQPDPAIGPTPWPRSESAEESEEEGSDGSEEDGESGDSSGSDNAN
jgi:hypothetical protein